MMRWRHASACGVVVALLCTTAPAMAAPTVTEYPISPGTSRGPLGVTVGPDGAVWFTESKGVVLSPPGIGRITPSGEISEYRNVLLAAPAASIALGPDGNLWFTEPSSHAIGRITTSGTITEFLISGSAQPQGIVAGPDGNLWFTQEAGHGSIGRITTSGEVSEFESGMTSGAKPLGIASGPDGALWFCESGGSGAIGRITTSGTISQYTTGLTANSEPFEIAAASDGDLYFTERKDPGGIGKVTPSGSISQVAIPTANSKPQGITAGPDGNVWFTEAADPGTIGELTLPPQVSALSPSGVSEQAATLNATVAPKSQLTQYHFEYGTTQSYGQSTPEASAGAGATATGAASTIGSLSSATTYHYRVVATNATGTTYGSDETFTTVAPPTVLTGQATAVDLTGGTLTGSVDPESQPTSYRFQWGTSTSYGSQTSEASAGSDSAEHPASESLTGLAPNTVYHFRLLASNCGWCGEGTTYGADEVFRTATEPPAATTSSAEAVTRTTAKLTGSVDPKGAATSYHFEWGQSASYEHRMPAGETAVGEDGDEHRLEQELDSLTPGTTYHYRIVATNCEGCAPGTTYGADEVFQTEAPALPEAPPPDPFTPGTFVSSPTVASSSSVAQSPPPPQSDPVPDPPLLGRSALLRQVSGSVLVKLPGAAGFRSLSSATDIPMGSVVDAEHGTLVLTTARDSGGHVQTVTVWGARFRVSQRKTRGGQTTLSLIGGRPSSCSRSHAKASTVAKASAAKARSRRSKTLWAKDSHGHFSTRGNNSVATVRGTYWGTVETCAGTLTIVRRGEVSVKPAHGHPVLVRAGHSYLARG
jgi:streptogramin lyase